MGDKVQPTSPFLRSGHFINLNSPLTCAGKLTAWHFCYYRSSVAFGQTSYTLQFSVWRPTSANTFRRIIKYLVSNSSEAGSDGVACESVYLMEDEFLTVQEGDILSVYIPFYQETVSVLAFEPSDGHHVFRDTSRLGNFRTRRLQRNDLSQDTAVALHLYADVSK